MAVSEISPVSQKVSRFLDVCSETVTESCALCTRWSRHRKSAAGHVQRRSRWLACRDTQPPLLSALTQALADMTLVSTAVETRRLDIQAAARTAAALLRVCSSRRATSGTSTAFISNRADDSLVVAYLKGRWGCARIPITPPVCVVLL